MFASEAERRAAYEGHRDQLGTWLGGFAGNRSSSFWEYDSDLAERPEGDDRLLYLAEHGHLEPLELSEIAQTSKNARARIGTNGETRFDAETATLLLARLRGAGGEGALRAVTSPSWRRSMPSVDPSAPVV